MTSKTIGRRSSVVAAVAILVAVSAMFCVASASSDDDTDADYTSFGSSLTHTISGTTLTISGTGPMHNFTLVSGSRSPVYQNTTITSVVIDDSVTTIGDNAFFGCTGLTGPLTIPASVTSIGDYAFLGCGGSGFVVAAGSASYKSVNGLLLDNTKTTVIACPTVRPEP
jgi:hypothetical protein